MKRLGTIAAIAAALLVGLAAGHVIAEEGEESGAPQQPKPGKEHEMLAKSVGEWDAHMKFWMPGSEEPLESQDECTCTMVMNDWFMEMDYRGSWDGQPWKGRLLSGYDQFRKEFFSIWTTDMGSEASISRGNMVKGVLTLRGEMVDGMSGRVRKNETTFEYPDDDTTVMSMYWVADDGSRGDQVMEITYKRKADAK